MRVAILFCVLYACNINAADVEMTTIKPNKLAVLNITMPSPSDTVPENSDVEMATGDALTLSGGTEMNDVPYGDGNPLDDNDDSDVNVMDIPKSALNALQPTSSRGIPGDTTIEHRGGIRWRW